MIPEYKNMKDFNRICGFIILRFNASLNYFHFVSSLLSPNL